MDVDESLLVLVTLPSGEAEPYNVDDGCDLSGEKASLMPGGGRWDGKRL